MVESALKAMTPEQLEEYMQVGEYMYSTTKFDEKNPQPRSLEDETTKGIFYIKESLKAGLAPEDMDQKEIQLMYDIYGPKWYEEYGYESDEVPKPPVALDTTMPDPANMKKIRKRAAKKMAKRNNPRANHKKKGRR